MSATASEAILTKIGISAKRHTQENIITKNVYDTGELHRTIDYHVGIAGKAVDVGSPKNYAKFPELGTIKMKARPFLRPAILDNAKEYRTIAENELKRPGN